MESKEDNTQEESTINGKYKIIETKGKGASAIVYLSEDITTKKQYAVKVLREKTPTFETEIKILEKVSSLNSPYIVNLIEFGQGPIKIASKPVKICDYLVLEFASKGELFDYIYCSRNGLKERNAKFIFHKILKGVQAFHNSGICHRDLKMQNILVDDFFNPKICDFGFASEIKGKDGSGKLTEFLGTINYASPEIFLHRPYNGVKADIFSLGVVLLNIVTCRIGFVQATRKDKYYKYIMIRKYANYWNSVQNQIGPISEELKDLYIKMVCFNPEERPTIEEIFKHPWMREVTDLNENEYKKLEKEVFEDFLEREIKVKESNEKLESDESGSDISLGNNRGLDDEGKIYFDLELHPKYYLKTGLNMNNYLKINGNLNPNHFLNNLANKISSEFGDKIQIDVKNKEKAKFNVIFENQEEEQGEQNEDEQKIEEELDKLGLEDLDEIEEEIERKESVIQIKLFESVNGGHLVRFAKKGGEIEEYHKNLDSIIKIIKELLK